MRIHRVRSTSTVAQEVVTCGIQHEAAVIDDRFIERTYVAATNSFQVERIKDPFVGTIRNLCMFARRLAHHVSSPSSV